MSNFSAVLNKLAMVDEGSKSKKTIHMKFQDKYFKILCANTLIQESKSGYNYRTKVYFHTFFVSVTWSPASSTAGRTELATSSTLH